jgi:hypothetical protein
LPTRTLADNKAHASRQGRKRKPQLEPVEARMLLSAYTHTTIDTPDTYKLSRSYVGGMNDLGHVVGPRVVVGNPQPERFLRSGGNITTLKFPGSDAKKKQHQPKPEHKHKPKPEHKHKPKPSPNPQPPSGPSSPANPEPPLINSITVTVMGNVAFLKNGVPTVAFGPIPDAQVYVDAQSEPVNTDENGSVTVTGDFGDGAEITVEADALTYIATHSYAAIPASGGTASVDIVLPDNTNVTTTRFPVFDGTGAGVVDNQGNQYQYLGRGEYYTTINGQLQVFLPFGGGEWQCPALHLYIYPSDENGDYDFGGAYYTFATGTVNMSEDVIAIYGQVSPGEWVDLSNSGIYFEPLP